MRQSAVIGLLAALWPLGLETSAHALTPSPDFQVVIAAPKQIKLAQTPSLTLLLSLVRRGDHLQTPLPKNFVVTTTQGDLTNPNEDGQAAGGITLHHLLTPSGGHELPLTLSFKDYTRGNVTASVAHIEVTTSDNPRLLLGSADIQVRYPHQLHILKITDFILADGKTTGQLLIQITDQAGERVEGMPFILRGYKGQKQDIGVSSDEYGEFFVIPGVTDAQGKALFIIPSSDLAGHGLLQLMSYNAIVPDIQLVTPQFDITYYQGKSIFKHDPFIFHPWFLKPYKF